MAAPAELLMDELVEEILLRLPPGDPARLLDAALVCKRWCRLVAGRGFRRRFRELHRTPPLLGFLGNIPGTGRSWDARFVPTSSFRPPNAFRRGLRAVHSGHGRVLLYSARKDILVVWDPVTDEQRELPVGPLCPYPSTLSWNAAVLCAGDRCNHLDCHRDPFLVVVVATTYNYKETTSLSSCVYTSEADGWSKPMAICAQGRFLFRFQLGNNVLLRSALYFKLGIGIGTPEILKYDLVTREMSLTRLSVGNLPLPMLMATEDGRLGCAVADEARLYLWSREHGHDNEARWEQSRVIELSKS